MDETKNASETEASQSPAGDSNGSSDETRSLSGTAGSQPPLESSSDFSDVDPSKIGRYRIIRRLGQGGFGRVYLAHDDELDRPVAIKVPNPERITRAEDARGVSDRSPHPRQAGPSPHCAGLRRGPHGRWALLRRVEAHRRQRPVGPDGSGSPVIPGLGGAGCHDCRRLALRPHPGPGPPGHQAREHPDRRIGQALRGGLRARPQG